MSFEDILYEVDADGVATLTINRPERMNALRPQTTTRDARGHRQRARRRRGPLPARHGRRPRLLRGR